MPMLQGDTMSKLSFESMIRAEIFSTDLCQNDFVYCVSQSPGSLLLKRSSFYFHCHQHGDITAKTQCSCPVDTLLYYPVLPVWTETYQHNARRYAGRSLKVVEIPSPVFARDILPEAIENHHIIGQNWDAKGRGYEIPAEDLYRELFPKDFSPCMVAE